nr:MAG TPA: Major capsid protein [Caudoviricetes sp.]
MEDETTTQMGEETTREESTTAAANRQGEQDKKQESKTYTQADFDKALRQEADKQIQQALKAAREKWQAEYERKLEEEKNEAQRFAKLSAEERAKEAEKKEKEKFETERKAFERERLKFEATKQLAEKEIPVSLADMVTGKDAEETNERIQTMEKALGEMWEKKKNELMRGRTPKAGEAKTTGDGADFFSIIKDNQRN